MLPLRFVDQSKLEVNPVRDRLPLGNRFLCSWFSNGVNIFPLRKKAKFRYLKSFSLAVFLFIMVFILAFFSLRQHIQIFMASQQIRGLEKSLVAWQKQNGKLKIELAQKERLDRIEKIAREKLGMSEPSKIEYIFSQPYEPLSP